MFPGLGLVQVGGAFTPSSEYDAQGTCEPNNSGELTRIGDLCLSTVAVQFDCKEASWQQQCQGYPWPAPVIGPQYAGCSIPIIFAVADT